MFYTVLQQFDDLESIFVTSPPGGTQRNQQRATALYLDPLDPLDHLVSSETVNMLKEEEVEEEEETWHQSL